MNREQRLDYVWRRERRRNRMLKIENLQATVDGKAILKGERRMKRWLLPASALLIAPSWACANAGPEDFRALPLPSETYAVPQDVFASTLRSVPEGREGRQELELSVRESDDGSYVVLLTATGLLDDSVGAEQHRAVLRYENGRWRVTQLGERWRCQPGRGSSGWGTRPCN